ncbi:putative bifunctional diguanylate cyclase/phosphodiesterase [Cupriavidus necator]|uniref:putative bifunctional diguanylate cyclase/phosphodiesterase n=1 Tax=Cupriavidus necator TaxID=106590 RepID=UPI00068D4913|nr:phosphodiesterase [Cupriavidus necator]
MENLSTAILSALTPIALSAAYLAIRTWLPNQRGVQVHLAILFGLAMWVTLVTAAMQAPGVIVDMRGTLLTLAVLFGGTVPALLVAAVGVMTRFWIGGVGTGIGIAALVVTYIGLVSLPRILPARFRNGDTVSGFHLIAGGLWASLIQWSAIQLAEVRSGKDLNDVLMPVAQFLVTTVSGSLFIMAQQRRNLRQVLESQHELAKEMMTHDTATGLLNRAGFTIALQETLNRHQTSSDARLAVITIGLHRFREISDAIGSQAVDILLATVGSRLRGLATQTPLGRLDSDTFGLYLENIGERTTSALADELHATFRRPISLGAQAVYLPLNIGVSIFPSDGTSSSTLISQSDQALRVATQRGDGHLQYFSSELEASAVRQLQLESALQHALRRTDEIRVVYQPKAHLATGKLAGVEALCRWDSRELGKISPSEFIPVAESSNLINEFGAWMLEQVCAQINVWRRQGLSAPVVAVNLSAKQLLDSQFPELALQCVRRHEISTSAIEFELTESAVMMDPLLARKLLERLRGFGFRLALDDFGTGYSNLAYLKGLPFYCLKIDKSFVKDIEHNRDSRSLCGGIFALGSSLGLTILAEGIETAGQLEILRNFGYQLGQGFYFAHPLSPDDLASRWLAD